MGDVIYTAEMNIAVIAKSAEYTKDFKKETDKYKKKRKL